MQLTDIRTAVRDRIGVSSNDGILTDTVLNRLINRAVKTFGSEHHWAWLEKSDSQSPTTNTVTMPSDWAATVSVSISGESRPLLWLPIDEFIRHDQANADPRFYTVYGDAVLIAPHNTAGVSLVHRYIAVEADLTSDTHEPLCPDHLIEPIIEFASALAYHQVGDIPLAQRAEDRYERRVQAYKTAAERQSNTRGGAVSAGGPYAAE